MSFYVLFCGPESERRKYKCKLTVRALNSKGDDEGVEALYKGSHHPLI